MEAAMISAQCRDVPVYQEDHPMPSAIIAINDHGGGDCTGAQGAGHADTGGCVRGEL
ncbi:MAG: hypothetical protein ACLUOI_18905 [Eisenbergiella sp.]